MLDHLIYNRVLEQTSFNINKRTHLEFYCIELLIIPAVLCALHGLDINDNRVYKNRNIP
jgi:hypothetical protein